MKIMFASDIHGSAYYCRKMLDIYSESGAGRLVILGDILYHGPRNDLPREYAPKEVIAMLNPLKDQIYAIRVKKGFIRRRFRKSMQSIPWDAGIP